MEIAVIAIGPNHAPGVHLPLAFAKLKVDQRWTFIAASPVYASADANPQAGMAASLYHNAAAAILTLLPPAQLRAALRTFEAELGRTRGPDTAGKVTIDLDLVLYGQMSVDGAELQVPDPDLLRYAHVAIPCADVAPTWRHPTTGESLRDIAQRHHPMEIVHS